MGKKRNQQPGQNERDEPFHSPFSDLKGLRDVLPEGEADEHEEPAEAAAQRIAPRRAVVRYQRKGRGGKEATLIEKLGLPAEDLGRWLTELKRELGCGGAVEGDVIALQGDQRKRLPMLLERRGVGRVSVS